MMSEEKKGSFHLEPSGVFRRTIPLWEARWDSESLRAKRVDMGEREFDRGFRQRAISDGDLAFPPAAIDACKDNALVAYDSVAVGNQFFDTSRYGGVDLALAELEAKGSFFVVLVIAVDRHFHRWVLWMERHRGITFNRQLEIVADVHKRFALTKIKVENNYYQKALVQVGELHHLPIEGYTTTALTKHDLQVGVPSMGAEFEQGRWHIPWGDARSRRLMEPLLEELHVFPLPGYDDDTVMALFFARECQKLVGVPRASFEVIDI